IEPVEPKTATRCMEFESGGAQCPRWTSALFRDPSPEDCREKSPPIAPPERTTSRETAGFRLPCRVACAAAAQWRPSQMETIPGVDQLRRGAAVL
ncbi:MAG: hypothetical protein ACK56I_01650, partial [bacterium]